MRTAMSKRKKIIMKLCMYLGYLLIAAIFIGPIVFLFVSSLKPYAQIESDMSNIRAFIPYGDLSLDNYINVIVKADFFKFFMTLTYLGEVLFSFGAVVLYCISFLISICSYIAISNKQT